MTTGSSNNSPTVSLNGAEGVGSNITSTPKHPTTSTSTTTSEQPSKDITLDIKKNMQSNTYTGVEAREGLMRGVNLVADAVKLTLGAAGSNGVIENVLPPNHEITNDGVSIARSIHPKDPLEKVGANLIKEIASRADKESGDGTTTAVVLAQAILKEGLKAEGSPMQIKRELDECLAVINQSLDEQSKEIDVDTVAQVASVSAEDESMGKLLQEIYQDIGKDGIIELDNSNTFETFFEIKEGVRLRNCGYLAPYMANEGVRAVYKKPKILITKQRISTLADIQSLFGKLEQAGTNEIVIFCEDIDQSVLSALAFTHVQGIFKSLVIKAPNLWKDWLFQDFAKITGATIVAPETGVTLKNAEVDHLGTCDKIVTSKEETTVIGIKDVSEHIVALEEEAKTNDQIKVRIAWLKTKAAVLKLGANSESELSYKRLKAEDARNASYLALKGGIVPGGGVALANVVAELPDTEGGRVLQKALLAPARQIGLNYGYDEFVVGLDFTDTNGFDAKRGMFVNMWEAGIVDPTLVVKNSVKSAISVAGTVLTTQIVTTLLKEDNKQQV